MGGIFTVAFWKATAERVVSTAAQFAIVAWIGAGAGDSAGVVLPPWTIAASAGAGGLLTLLKCIAASTVGGGDAGPSLTGAERLKSDWRPWRNRTNS